MIKTWSVCYTLVTDLLVHEAKESYGSVLSSTVEQFVYLQEKKGKSIQVNEISEKYTTKCGVRAFLLLQCVSHT